MTFVKCRCGCSGIEPAGTPAARRPVLAVDQQDVGPAVAVSVEESTSRAHRLRQKLLPCPAAVVRELDAGLRGNIRELLTGGGGRDQKRHGYQHGTSRWSSPRSGARFHDRECLSFVIVFRADHARAAVMACEDSSALKRRNRASLRAPPSAVAETTVAEHQRVVRLHVFRIDLQTSLAAPPPLRRYSRFRKRMRPI